jgi:hypothetical protein
MSKELQPHQQRVVDEQRELDTKIVALRTFIKGDIFNKLDVQEQTRLELQIGYMEGYSSVLGRRIAAF